MINYIHNLLSEIDVPSTIIHNEHPSFLLSLMVLSSYVIQADGEINHSEIEFIRNFLAENYGKEKKEKYIGILLKLFEESKKYPVEAWSSRIKECAMELNNYTTEDQRILLISFLIKIVKADEHMDYLEVQSLKDIAEWLGVGLDVSEKLNNLSVEEVWTWVI